MAAADLEKQTHWVGPGGSAKEATAPEFPISQSIAGVSMRLEPGAISELHWHTLAAEWAYMLKGRCRATVISPNGQADVSDFSVGDTWYFPRGHGHVLQCLGPGPCHFLLVFDNGHFSEFGTFDAPTGSPIPPARDFPGGTEHMVTAKEFPIQTTLTAVRMDLEPGALREMHWHRMTTSGNIT